MVSAWRIQNRFCHERLLDCGSSSPVSTITVTIVPNLFEFGHDPIFGLTGL